MIELKFSVNLDICFYRVPAELTVGIADERLWSPPVDGFINPLGNRIIPLTLDPILLLMPG